MTSWDDPPAGRRPGPPSGVRLADPWAAAEQDPLPTRTARLFTRRARSLLLLALAPALVLGVRSILGQASLPEPSPSPAPQPPPSTAAGDPDPSRRTYAVALPSLRGLPENAAPGTPLELWVAWDRPIGGRGRIQRLLEDVRLVRIVPPVLPGAPPAALLSVPAATVGDLLYGDFFGRFAVTVRG